MTTEHIVTISQMGFTSSGIVIPKAILKGFGLKNGQKLTMTSDDKGFYVQVANKGVIRNAGNPDKARVKVGSGGRAVSTVQKPGPKNDVAGRQPRVKPVRS